MVLQNDSVFEFQLIKKPPSSLHDIKLSLTKVILSGSFVKLSITKVKLTGSFVKLTNTKVILNGSFVKPSNIKVKLTVCPVCIHLYVKLIIKICIVQSIKIKLIVIILQVCTTFYAEWLRLNTMES